jgi:hypothetical protein
MKPLSSDELQMNQDAVTVASTVLGQPVEAATRLEQVSMDQVAAAAGVGSINRGMMRGMMKMNKVSSVGRMGDGLRTGGLPNSFVLAVTSDEIHAIEDKHSGSKLAPGKVIRSWPREGFVAKRGSSIANTGQGITEDRQQIILHLPIEGGHNRYLKAAAANTAAVGGKPYRFMCAKDAPSEALLDAIVVKGAAAMPNIMVGGQSLQDMMGQAAAAQSAADPTEQLSKLADLRDRGVLTDDEFAAQKAKILGT